MPAARRTCVAALVSLTIAAGLSACSSGGPGSDSTAGGGSTEEILIGVPAPLTGGGGAYGLPQTNAAQMVADAINASGGIKELGGAKLKLIVKDTTTSPTTAAQLIREMAQQKVSAFIGPVTSPEVVANIPLIRNLKIPAFLGSGTPLITQDNANGFFFRTSTTTPATATADAQYVASLIKSGELKDVNKVGILITSTPPGDLALPALQQSLQQASLPTEVVTYDPTQVKDFAPLIARLKAADVDIIMGYQGPNDTTLLAQAISGQEWRPSSGFFLTNSATFLDSVRKSLGSRVSGWVTSAFCASLQTEAFTKETQQVAKDFQAKYNQTMEGSGGCIGATNMALIADAIAAAKSKDPSAIAVAARKLSFSGPKDSAYPYYMTPGGVKFDQDQNNTAILAPIIQVTADGGYTTVSPKAFANAPLKPQTP
jgi:branched-chain amino acid transport system substrate-binding protein